MKLNFACLWKVGSGGLEKEGLIENWVSGDYFEAFGLIPVWGWCGAETPKVLVWWMGRGVFRRSRYV